MRLQGTLFDAEEPERLPPPRPLRILSPGSVTDAEAYLATITGGELLTYGGVLVDWPDGIRWQFAAMPTPGAFIDGAHTAAELRQANEDGDREGRCEGIVETWKEAGDVARETFHRALETRTPAVRPFRCVAPKRRYKKSRFGRLGETFTRDWINRSAAWREGRHEHFMELLMDFWTTHANGARDAELVEVMR